MPYKIEERENEFCVVNSETGETVKCHADEQDAKDHMAALYANVEDAASKGMDLVGDTLVVYGDTIKALGGGRIGGFLVSYGSPTKRDLTGVDWFSPHTDFGDASQSDVYLHHGLPVELKRKNGKHEQVALRFVLSKADLKKEDAGIWAETLLDMHDEYERMLYGMATKGALAWSSGTLPHLVVRDDATGEILKWPLGLDASLTPTPAEPDEKNRVKPLKSLKSLPLELPEATAEAGNRAGAASTDPAATAVPSQNDKSAGMVPAKVEEEMNPEEKQELLAEMKAAIAESTRLAIETNKQALDAAITALKAEPPITPAGGLKTQSPAHNRTPRGDNAFKAFSWFLHTGDASGIHTGDAYDSFMKTDYHLLEGTQYQGQEAVPTEVYAGIVQKRDPLSAMRAGKAMIVNAKSNAMVIPVEKASPQAWGITSVDGTNTFTTLTQQPIDKLAATLYMFTYNLPFDIQLIDDATFDIEGWGSQYVARGLAITENTYLLMGTGSGQPQGAVYAGSTGVSAAAAAAVTAGEIAKLYYTLPTEYQDNVIWVMQTATHGIVRALSGNPFYFVGNGGANGGAGQGGFPNGSGWLVDERSRVFTTGAMDALAASKKPISVMNPGAGYAIVDRKGLTVLRDPYSEAGKGLVNIWFYARFSGGVVNATAIQNLVTPSA